MGLSINIYGWLLFRSPCWYLRWTSRTIQYTVQVVSIHLNIFIRKNSFSMNVLPQVLMKILVYNYSKNTCICKNDAILKELNHIHSQDFAWKKEYWRKWMNGCKIFNIHVFSFLFISVWSNFITNQAIYNTLKIL